MYGSLLAATAATGDDGVGRRVSEGVVMSDPAGAAIEDAVEIRLPADSAYLSVLRTATAGLAARLDFTLDEIEDLRIAVDEACAMLLPQALESSQLICRFTLTSETIEVTVTIPTTDGELPATNTFSWTVLAALAGDVDAGSDDDRQVWIRLRKRRGAVGGIS
jgi:serine/threonine-protein kinase RsbW